MKPSDLAATLTNLYETRVPAYVTSAPGLGKSAIGYQVSKALDIEFMDVRGLLHDPSDLKFPMVDLKEKTIKWVQSIFPADPDWKGLILLEELALCPTIMQGAFLQVVWDRAIGEYKLPDGAWIVATGNRAEDRAGAGRIITPLLNRFVHFQLDLDHEDWHTWAIVAGVSPEVRSFLRWKPELMHQFRPEVNEPAFASPRSWFLLSKIIAEHADAPDVRRGEGLRRRRAGGGVHGLPEGVPGAAKYRRRAQQPDDAQGLHGAQRPLVPGGSVDRAHQVRRSADTEGVREVCD